MSGYLCEDLIGEIFERLPAKSLVRFRCLSKSWYTRIGSPHFRRRHHLLQSSQKILMIRKWEASSPRFRVRKTDYDRRDKVKDLYYMLHSDDRFSSLCHNPLEYFDVQTSSTNEFPFQFSKVVNSCNGILCLVDYREKRISLWNPSIRRKFILPDHPSFFMDHHGKELDIAIGFGFDPITEDYKIVRISYDKYEETVQNSFVYFMKTHTWSSIAPPVTPLDYLRLQVCFVNGVLHFVAHRFINEPECYILTFNLSSHVFGMIMLPELNLYTRKPTVINGCLAVVSCEILTGNSWIYVMKEYNNAASWYVHFKMKSNQEKDRVKSVMQLSTDGCFLINDYRYGLRLYNHVTGVSFVLYETRFNKVYMETCTESLELLDIGELLS